MKSEPTLVRCTRCGVLVRKDRYQQHYYKVHRPTGFPTTAPPKPPSEKVIQRDLATREHLKSLRIQKEAERLAEMKSKMRTPPRLKRQRTEAQVQAATQAALEKAELLKTKKGEISLEMTPGWEDVPQYDND